MLIGEGGGGFGLFAVSICQSSQGHIRRFRLREAKNITEIFLTVQPRPDPRCAT